MGTAPTLQAGDAVRPVDGGVTVADGTRWVAVHSLRNPLREAETLVAQALDGRDSSLLVVIGLGQGYILDALDARGWSGRVLAIEPEPALVAYLHARRDLDAWHGRDRLRILTAPDFDGVADCWRWFDGSGAVPPVIVNPALARIRAEATTAARGLVERLCFNAKANADARRTFGGRYLLNTLANIPAIAREGDVATLAGAAKGMPAIVVAAGPSLDANLGALREVRDRALIIAVDTALCPLLAAGITPHLVVAVDPSEANARHLWNAAAPPATHFVAEASLDPSALAGFRGRTFLFSVSDHEPWPWLRAHGAGRGRLRAWGSVLTSAFDLALEMGCEPVAFAGADLAFTNKRPYASGVVYEDDWRYHAAWGRSIEQQWRDQIDAWPVTEVVDVNGRHTRTAPHLVAFRDWLVEQIGRAQPRRIVNLTGGGILHGGRVEQGALDAFVASLPTLSVRPADVVRARYAPARGTDLLDAAAALADDRSGAIDAWERFAEGISRPLVLGTVADALSGAEPATAVVPHPTARVGVQFDAHWIQPLAAQLRLVEMPIPRGRMEAYTEGVRRFRFRTDAARIISCVLTLPYRAVLEDGQPMQPAHEIASMRPGEFMAWRDEIYVTASDGTDPRRNGRTYTVLVPETIAFLERLPLDQVLAHHV